MNYLTQMFSKFSEWLSNKFSLIIHLIIIILSADEGTACRKIYQLIFFNVLI